MGRAGRRISRLAGFGAAALALVAAPLTGSLFGASAQPGPALSFSSPGLTFAVPVGVAVRHEARVTLANTGGSATGVLKLTMVSENALFTIADDTCPRSLGPGRSCTVTVRFAPAGLVPTASADLEATSSRGASATLNVSGVARVDGAWNFCDANPDNVYDENCIYGTESSDYVYGTILMDYVWGYGGNDNLHGAGDSDVIYGGDGDDLVHGGLYPDVLYGEAGDDTIYGNEAADEIWVGPGNNVAEGGDGADHVYGDSGNDSLSGNDGDDYLDGGGGSDLVSGGGGDDTMDNPADGARDNFDGGNGYDACYSGDPAGTDVFTNCEYTWTPTTTQ